MDGHTRTPERWLLRLVLAAVVCGVSAVVALDGVPAWEASLFRSVHTWPDWIEPVLWAPMQLGSLLGPGIVAGASWLAWGRWRPTLGAVVAGIVSWWLAQVVKELVDRARPHVLFSDLERRAGAPTDGLGFVSGHTTVAFALAAVVSPYLSRNQRVVAYALAGSVALARVHVGAHLPLDVIAGGALGYGVGWLWNVAVGVPTDVEGRTRSGAALAR
jgi:glycosyltransferase 2 family protein